MPEKGVISIPNGAKASPPLITRGLRNYALIHVQLLRSNLSSIERDLNLFIRVWKILEHQLIFGKPWDLRTITEQPAAMPLAGLT